MIYWIIQCMMLLCFSEGQRFVSEREKLFIVRDTTANLLHLT